MEYQGKTKEELILELKKLQAKYDSLNELLEKDAIENEARSRGLLFHFEAGIVIHAPDTSIIDSNPKAEVLLGLSQDQMKGKLALDPNWKFIQEDNTPLPIEKYPVNQIKNSRKSLKHFVAGINRPSTNDIVWVMVNGFPVLDNNGEVTEIVISFIDITESKNLENKIAELNEFNETLISSMQDGIAIINKDGIQTRVNESFCKMTGFTNEELIGTKAPFQYWPPEEYEKINKAFQITLNENTSRFELNFMRKNGERFPVIVSPVPIKNKQGIVISYAATIVDITYIKQAEAALIENEERYRVLVENAPEALVVIDMEFQKFVSVSKSAVELFKMTKEELLNVGVAEISPKYQPDGRLSSEVAMEKISEAIEGGKPVFEWTHQDSQGKQIPCEVRLVRLPFENKILIRGSVNDITEHKKAQEAIRQNEQTFSILFEKSGIPTSLSILPEGIIININEAFERAFGYSKQEAIGKSSGELGVNPDAETTARILAEITEHGYTHNKEVILHSKSNGKRICNVNIDVITITNKKYVLSTIMDVTERKQAEKAIIESQRLMAMGEMASSIAHDFNNSLQVMMGNIEVSKLKIDLKDPTLEYLNNIESIISDVANRVKSLQRFGNTKRESAASEFVDLNTIIEESIIQLRPMWKDNLEKEGKTINIKTDYGFIPKINCNKGELKTSIINLIKNSIEAMPDGGNINIETGLKGKEVFVTFTDTGIGMNEETKLKIFQPFYTTKGFEAGRGLGMTGVYSVVKEYGGDISVKFSELGKGTKIEIVFPIHQQDEIKENIFIKEKELTDEIPLRVLWVDDHGLINMSARKIVESMGHKCDTVNSGMSALEYLKKNKYDIVITDIGMPDMSGWQLADAINNKFSDEIKIVVCSGWSIDEKEKKEHNVTYVLSKPFTRAELKKIFSDFNLNRVQGEKL